jgi:osmoprotectant transport system ATP-binding protein
VTEQQRPRGWVDTATLASLPGGTILGQVRTEPIGHSFTLGDDSLRAALDAAVLSPAGQAVAVDDDGKVLGVATFDQLRAAIQRETAQTASTESGESDYGEDSRQAQPAQVPPS